MSWKRLNEKQGGLLKSTCKIELFQCERVMMYRVRHTKVCVYRGDTVSAVVLCSEDVLVLRPCIWDVKRGRTAKIIIIIK